MPTLKARARHVARRLSRLRWLTKREILQRYSVSLREQPGVYLRYLLWDPEVESYSYDIANDDELCTFAAANFGITADDALAYLAEARTDPELTTRLSERTRWRFDSKTKLPIGNRLLWYVAARATKPTLIVETGIYEGLGSIVLLQALARNAEDGVEGRLVSLDFDPMCGFLVRDDPVLTERWTKVIGMTSELLPKVVEGEPIGMLLQDTPHTEENQRHEFGVALRQAADPVILIEGSGGYCPTLGQLAEQLGIERQHFIEKPRDHFWPAPGQGVLVVPAEAAKAWPGWPD
ncbi:MAG: class I SAM-dependent methyltransferase [Solirubrobacteraceae bacterium]|nr:class I SAM-dependent methyltransferase [Solirubrobacteraceae bacterium]